MIATLINYKDFTNDTSLPKGKPCVLVDTETNEVLYPITTAGVSDPDSSIVPPTDGNGAINTDKLISFPINFPNLVIRTAYRVEYITDPILLTPGAWIVSVKARRLDRSDGLSGPSYITIVDDGVRSIGLVHPTHLQNYTFPAHYWSLTSLMIAIQDRPIRVGMTFGNGCTFGRIAGEFVAAKMS